MKKDTFHCPLCGWAPAPFMPEIEEMPDHCPNCLEGRHEQREDGVECGGILKPISIIVEEDDSWTMVQRCSLCGELRQSPVLPEDNPVMLLSVASKPLANPPFPLERLAQMQELAGVQGSMEGYYHEEEK